MIHYRVIYTAGKREKRLSSKNGCSTVTFCFCLLSSYKIAKFTILLHLTHYNNIIMQLLMVH